MKSQLTSTTTTSYQRTDCKERRENDSIQNYMHIILTRVCHLILENVIKSLFNWSIICGGSHVRRKFLLLRRNSCLIILHKEKKKLFSTAHHLINYENHEFIMDYCHRSAGRKHFTLQALHSTGRSRRL